MGVISNLKVQLIICLVLVCPVAAQDPMMNPSELGIGSQSLSDWQNEAKEQLDAISSAYGLAPEMAEALRAELQARILAQIQFEATELAALVEEAKAAQAAADAGAEPVDLLPKLAALNSKMPMNEEHLVGWIESRLPESSIADGRQRWQEIRELRQKKLKEAEYEAQLAPQSKVELGQAVTQASTKLSPHDDMPVPNDPANDRYYTEIKVRDAGGEVILAPNRKSGVGSDMPPPGELTKGERLRLAQIEAAEREGRRKPGAAGLQPHGEGMEQETPRESIVIEQPPAPQVTVQVAPTPPAGQPAGRAAPSAPAAKEIVYATAPPLDDWDKYVQEHAKKVGFDDAQLTRAQAVLKDLKRRANQYRMSRSDMFAVAALKTDAKEREAMTKNLNKPIDAMFDELKQRIDSLMTHEQRQKVAAGKK